MNGTPQLHHTSTPTSSSATRSDHTYLMPTSPIRDRRPSTNETYRPEITNTIGQKPACLVSASVTYVGNNEIYAFGGFDQYTDEVYNHVLRLNLDTRQWNLVDNYGDIPGVRMGHTATLWRGDKVLIFGGENEHRAYLADLIIFDIKTAHWTQPEVRGHAPRGRARHAAVLHGEKLFIIGGLSGLDNNTVLDDFCYLDLKTFEWSRTWRFTPRFDHTCWVWAGKIWVFGGSKEWSGERANDIWWLDPKQSPCLDSMGSFGSLPPSERRTSAPRAPRPQYPHIPPPVYTGYAANSSSVQMNQAAQTAARKPAPMAPGSISSLSFVSGPNIPTQSYGTHFHVFSSGCLLDFTTPSVTSSMETSLCALELETLRWEKLADGRDLFNPLFRWHYCVLNQEGTQAWLLGCPTARQNELSPNDSGEYLSHVLSVDLKKLGLLGNSLAIESRLDSKLPTSDTNTTSPLSGIGADLARMFDQESGSGTDFIVTAESDDLEDEDDDGKSSFGVRTLPSRVSRPIHVHRLILEARWPHFARMIASQMAEFHSKKLHIPEPYSVVRAFLYYLYTDSIAATPPNGPALDDVAGMLVMSNLYDMPRLRLLCRNRLGRELNVEHAASIWERAGAANEEWLKRRAARYCLTYWGRVVRTVGFRNLKPSSNHDLCAEIDLEGRVLGAEELETVGGLGGARFGNGSGLRDARSRRFGSSGLGDDLEEVEDDDGMELS